MSDSPNNGIVLTVSALAATGIGIMGYKYYNSRKRQSALPNNTRTAIVYQDSPTEDNEPRTFIMFPLNDDTTLATLKSQIAQTFHISNPRLFLHRNSQEVSEKDVKTLPEMIIITTADDKPLSYCQSGTLPIPNGPTPKPWIGNMMDLIPNIAKSSMHLFKEYGPVFKLSLPSRGAKNMIFIADAELAEEIMTQPNLWAKIHMKHAKKLREQIGDGLFTSDDDEEIWQSAHKILLPAFSTNGMKQYFEMVVDCSNEIQNQFQNLAESREVVDINDWAARFTLEVIGRVAFGIQFDSFNNRPEFLEDLENAFCENLLTLWQRLIPSPSRTAKVKRAWNNINQFIQDIIDRKREEIRQSDEARKKKDLITLMLCAEDPKTHSQLPNDNIRSQVLTFLVAGHDSTSSAITSLLYHISIHPEVEQKIMEEVIRVVGDGPVQWNHLAQLEYCTQVIKENLRLFPPAGAVRKTCVEDTKLGPYAVKKGTAVLIAFWALHYNPTYWPDPNKFDPERFSKENSANRNQFAWLPFSTGPRGCIGQQLSVMEQKIFLATVFRNYCCRLHMSAKIEVTFPLFVKPNGVNMVISKRPPFQTFDTSKNNSEGDLSTDNLQLKELLKLTSEETQVELNLFVLYGSNMETSFGYAQQIDAKARDLGHNVSTMSLDQFIASNSMEQLRQNSGHSALVIITSTYNGAPPDNAVEFKSWITGLDSNDEIFAGIKYCVFGCGNSQWKTFQMFPTFIDQRIQALGGSCLCKLGKGDADKTIDDDFSQWMLNMWLGIFTEFNIANTLQTNFSTNPNFAHFDIQTLEDTSVSNCFKKGDFGKLCEFAASNQAFMTECLVNQELQQTQITKRSTRHIQFTLPENVHYCTGDHLAVCPFNSQDLVKQAAEILHLELGQYIIVTSSTSQSRTIPHNIPITIQLLFECFLDLQAPINRNQLNYLSTKASCPPEKSKLAHLASVNEDTSSDHSTFESYILKPKRTLLQILQEFKSIELTLGDFLSIVPSLRPRYYSISSSAKKTPQLAEITVGVVSHSTLTGRIHNGVSSNFLGNLQVGQLATVFVKDTKSSFRLPSDLSVPIILVGAGTGLAPLRGFLHERKYSGATGENILVFGCRTDADFIYRQELEEFVRDGTLTQLYVAFSRKQSAKVYVQHKILEHAQQIHQLLLNGAHVYVCGEAKYMATGVRKAFCSVIQQLQGISLPLAEEYLSHLSHSGRYNEDVWAS